MISNSIMAFKWNLLYMVDLTLYIFRKVTRRSGNNLVSTWNISCSYQKEKFESYDLPSKIKLKFKLCNSNSLINLFL